ncbi:hypothetical protein ACP90_24980 [Labrenzia sp. CP4]|nr:hypothetical protein ACP90_24980 [Labrenzia sp. CP4]
MNIKRRLDRVRKRERRKFEESRPLMGSRAAFPAEAKFSSDSKSVPPDTAPPLPQSRLMLDFLQNLVGSYETVQSFI